MIRSVFISGDIVKIFDVLNRCVFAVFFPDFCLKTPLGSPDMDQNVIFDNFINDTQSGHNRSHLVTPGHTLNSWSHLQKVTSCTIWSHLVLSGHIWYYLVTYCDFTPLLTFHNLDTTGHIWFDETTCGKMATYFSHL